MARTVSSDRAPIAAEVALRLHFGMNGSLLARKAKDSRTKRGVAPWKRNDEPSLRLYFADRESLPGTSPTYTLVEAWDTTVSYPVSAASARNKLSKLSSRDVCSASFNAQDVFTSIRQLGNGSIVADALLNQNIVPGVGNIIKIESLHQSGIDPRRVVSSLSDAELRRLVRNTRMYSMDWLNTGRAGTKRVYNQTSCGTCQGMTVKMQKMGGATGAGGSKSEHAFMSRVTFWCTVCQPATVSQQNRNPPLSTNSDIRAKNGNALNTTTIANRPQAQCPQHGSKSIKLCRVRKGNRNVLRIFFTCKFRGCQFFSWADGQFPNCRCDGHKAIMRVSKTEKSGGRWFLCCASGDRSNKDSRSNGCGVFEWAKEENLAPLRSHLTPLL
ncbi:hypothetical protein ACHAWF_002314 [Thalassiosira exigua]